MVTPDSRPSGEEGVPVMADAVMGVARAALAASREVGGDSIEIRRRDVYMPMQAIGLTLARQTVVIPRPTYAGFLRTTVGYLRVGDVEAVCVPGEMEPGLAARLRRELRRPDLLVFGLVDDEIGYLLSERDARDDLFAYERSMAPCVDAGERIVRALVEPN
jgi:hypothetical protein